MFSKKDLTVGIWVALIVSIFWVLITEPRGDQASQIERLKKLEIMENNALAASYGRKLTSQEIISLSDKWRVAKK